MILLFLGILAVGVVTESWTLMMFAGMAHAELLTAIQPISFSVALLFILVTLPAQAVGLALGMFKE
jgi:hypothetical protein